MTQGEKETEIEKSSQGEKETETRKRAPGRKRIQSKKAAQGEEGAAKESTPHEEDTAREDTPREEVAGEESKPHKVGAAGKTKLCKVNAAKKSKPKKKSKAKAKPGPKRRSPPRRSPGKKKIDPPVAEGEGGRQLLTAVNSQVVKRSADIAKALVDGTVKGSASHARLVVGLSGAGGLAAAPTGARRTELSLRDSGFSFTAEDLPGSEENWEFDVAPEARPGYIPPES
jgi:hypothetical protein